MTRDLITTLFFILVFQNVYTQDYSFEWVYDFGDYTHSSAPTDPGTYSAEEWPSSIEVDNQGNIYHAGMFLGNPDADPQSSVHIISSGQYRTAYLQKVSSDKQLIWALSLEGLGGSSGTHLNRVSLDQMGNIYLTGIFFGTLDADPGSGLQPISTSGAHAAYIIKLTSDGDFIWVKTFDDGIFQDVHVTADAQNNIIFGGNFTGTADFDPGIGVHTMSSPGVFSHAFIVKLTENGDFIWGNSLGNAQAIYVKSLSIDNSNSINCVGAFNGTVDFDPGAGSHFETSSTGTNGAYLLQLDQSGSFNWVKSFENSSFNHVKNTSNSNSVVTCQLQGTTDLDPGTSTHMVNSATDGRLVLVKYDDQGNFIWAKGMQNQNGLNSFGDLHIDDHDFIYSTGVYETMIDLDPGVGADVYTASQLRSCFIQKLNSNGEYIYGTSVDGSYFVGSFAITADVDHSIICGGVFRETINFSLQNSPFTMTAKGDQDVFILKLSQVDSEIPTPNPETPTTDISQTPNIFTPNADNTNDLFMFSNKFEDGFISGTILNRWGNAVFETDSFDNTWNGNSKNMECADGTYFWIVKYTKSGIEYEESGMLTLIR